MMPQTMNLSERPPYVSFEVRSDEDRAASIAAGHWVGKDIDYAIITPAGSKDRIERVASEWFDHLALMVQQQRFQAAWLREYKEAYRAWKNDEEMPASGFPLRNWPPLSPSQYKQLRLLRVLTVEDLAAANEETINRIGMGARSLKARAQEWLANAAANAPAEQIAALKAENADLQASQLRMARQLEQMATQLNALGVVGARNAENVGSGISDESGEGSDPEVE